MYLVKESPREETTGRLEFGTLCGVSSPIQSPIQSLAASPPQEIVLEIVWEMTLDKKSTNLSPCGLLSWTFVDSSTIQSCDRISNTIFLFLHKDAR